MLKYNLKATPSSMLPMFSDISHVSSANSQYQDVCRREKESQLRNDKLLYDLEVACKHSTLLDSKLFDLQTARDQYKEMAMKYSAKLKIEATESSIAPSSNVLHIHTKSDSYDQERPDEVKLPLPKSSLILKPADDIPSLIQAAQQISNLSGHHKQYPLIDDKLMQPYQDHLQADDINASNVTDSINSSNQEEIPIIKPLPTIDDLLMTAGQGNKQNNNKNNNPLDYEHKLTDDSISMIPHDEQDNSSKSEKRNEPSLMPIISGKQVEESAGDSPKNSTLIKHEVENDHFNPKALKNDASTVVMIESSVLQPKINEQHDIHIYATDSNSDEQSSVGNIISHKSDDVDDQDKEMVSQDINREVVIVQDVDDNKNRSSDDNNEKDRITSKLSFESSTSDDDSSSIEQSISSKKSLSNIEESIKYDQSENENQQQLSTNKEKKPDATGEVERDSKSKNVPEYQSDFEDSNTMSSSENMSDIENSMRLKQDVREDEGENKTEAEAYDALRRSVLGSPLSSARENAEGDDVMSFLSEDSDIDALEQELAEIVSPRAVASGNNANERSQRSSIRRLPSIPASQSAHNIKGVDDSNQDHNRPRSRSAGTDQTADQPQSPTLEDTLSRDKSYSQDSIGDAIKDESQQTVQKIRQVLMSDDMDDENMFDLEPNTPKKEIKALSSDDDFDFYG